MLEISEPIYLLQILFMKLNICPQCHAKSNFDCKIICIFRGVKLYT